MLDYEHDKGATMRVLDRFVRDHPSRAWAPVTQSTFIFADRNSLRTPMGSGIAAANSQEGAERMKKEFGGELMDWSRLANARREWMQARYGTSGHPDPK